MQILRKVIILPGRFAGILDAKANRTAALIIQITQRIPFRAAGGEPLFGYRQAVYDVVFCISAVGIGFPGTQTVSVVLVAIGCRLR